MSRFTPEIRRWHGVSVRLVVVSALASVAGLFVSPSSSDAATCSVSPTGACSVVSAETDGRQTHWSLELTDVDAEDFRVTLHDDDGELYVAIDSDGVSKGHCIDIVACDNGETCQCEADGDETDCDSSTTSQAATCAGYVAADETWYFDICEC